MVELPTMGRGAAPMLPRRDCLCSLVHVLGSRSYVIHRLAGVSSCRVLVVAEDHERRALRPADQRSFGLVAVHEAQALRVQTLSVDGHGALQQQLIAAIDRRLALEDRASRTFDNLGAHSA